MAKRIPDKKRRKTSSATRGRQCVPVEARVMVLCEAVSRDPGGRPSLYGLFDKIIANTFPVTYKPFTLYAQVFGDGTYQIAIELRSPDGTVNKVGEFAIQCKPPGHANLEVVLAGLQFPGPGEYQVVLTSSERPISSPQGLTLEKKKSK